jgi:hypothetical protein
VDVEVLISGTRHEIDFGLDVRTHYAYGQGFEVGTRGGIKCWNTLTHLRLLRLIPKYSPPASTALRCRGE